MARAPASSSSKHIKAADAAASRLTRWHTCGAGIVCLIVMVLFAVVQQYGPADLPAPEPTPSATGGSDSSARTPPLVSLTLVNTYPHDANAFTQGLVVAGGTFWESTGMYGQSTVRRVEVATGRVLASTPLGAQYFGEGLTALNGKLYQLTWQERTLFVWNQQTLAAVRTAPLPFVGWGLTTDGTALILSDGSSTLYFLDPDTLVQQRKVSVTVGPQGKPLASLNELEWIDGICRGCRCPF